MKKAVLYIHGKGGSAEEAAHYRPLFPGWEVIGFAYRAATPWEAKAEFSQYFDRLSQTYDHILMIANSIGAYFTMQARRSPPCPAASIGFTPRNKWLFWISG